MAIGTGLEMGLPWIKEDCVMIDMEAATAEEIASYFSHETNRLSFSPEGIAGEQRGSKQMEDLDICWIRILSSHAYGTDLRNERSAQVGRELAGIPFVRKKMESVRNGKMEEVAEMMGRDHRTIQQSFSRLVFFHFSQSCSQREARILAKAMGGSFYRLPLI